VEEAVDPDPGDRFQFQCADKDTRFSMHCQAKIAVVEEKSYFLGFLRFLRGFGVPNSSVIARSMSSKSSP
jgi:hypothetical protein